MRVNTELSLKDVLKVKTIHRIAQGSDDLFLPQVRYYAVKSLITGFLGGDVYTLLFPPIGL